MRRDHDDGYDYFAEAEAREEARGTSAECDESMYADWVMREPTW